MAAPRRDRGQQPHAGDRAEYGRGNLGAAHGLAGPAGARAWSGGGALADGGDLAGALGLGVGRLGALACPVLVELDPPFAVLALAQGELGAEAASAASAKAGHGPLGVALLDQF